MTLADYGQHPEMLMPFVAEVTPVKGASPGSYVCEDFRSNLIICNHVVVRNGTDKVLWLRMTPAHSPADIITNGHFTGDADDWTLGTNWAYRTNDIEHTASAAVASWQQLDAGGLGDTDFQGVRTLLLAFDIANRTAGTVTPSWQNASLEIVAGTARSTDGTYLEVFRIPPIGAARLFLTPTSTFDGRIDNVKLFRDGAHESLPYGADYSLAAGAQQTFLRTHTDRVGVWVPGDAADASLISIWGARLPRSRW